MFERVLRKCVKVLKLYRIIPFVVHKDYDENFLRTHVYQELFLLKKLNKSLYISCKEKAETAAVNALRQKKVIKLAFVVPMIQTWLGEEILDIFSLDDRFEASVIICSFDNGSSKFMEAEFKRTVDYFKKRDFKCYLVRAGEKNWETTGRPDICFYISPYLDALPEAINLFSMPLSTLTCYVGYGYMLAHIEKMQFNLPIHNLLWKHYIHTPIYKDIAKDYSDIRGRNMIFSGYPKMDVMYGKIKSDTEWKCIDANADKVIKIIYAPHQSIGNAVPQFGTFDMNYQQMYELARDNVSATSWIVKPHPVLRKTVESEGLMSAETYDIYLKKWNDLPNAQVIEDGDYLKWFQSSDCIVLDSVSFLAEYLFTQKPIFFLNRGNIQYNKFGKMIQRVIYQVDPGDISHLVETITKYLNEDALALEREALFREYIDYLGLNGKLAYRFIYDDIKESFVMD